MKNFLIQALIIGVSAWVLDEYLVHTEFFGGLADRYQFLVSTGLLILFVGLGRLLEHESRAEPEVLTIGRTYGLFPRLMAKITRKELR